MGMQKLGLLGGTVLVWTAWLSFEWQTVPNCTPLLGPLLLVWYGFSGAWILVASLLPPLFAYPARPNTTTAGISIIALIIWTMLGVVAETIGC
jgi:hypothetical protein